jgi:hypothetical protein
MTLNNTNEQEPNGSTKRANKEFEEKLRQARVRGMKEYREKKNQPPENQI